MAVIAVTNYKGGVGKTTSTINLAAALQENGKKVLIVDFDPQSNLTIHAGFRDVEALDATLSELLLARLDSGRKAHRNLDSIIHTLPSGLDLIPCNHHLVLVEQRLAHAEGREQILRQILADLENRYDFVIIDCLPGAGLLSTNALTAADYALVPVQAEYLAMQGLAYLLQYVAYVRANFNSRLQILGVLMTMVDLRTLHSREVLNAIRQVFQTQIRVFYSMVKVDVKLREASKAGQTILEYAPTSKGAEAYRSLAREILEILPDYEEDPNRGTLADPELVTTIAETATSLELEAIANGHQPARSEDLIVPTASQPITTPAIPAAEGSGSARRICPRLGFLQNPGQHASEPHGDHVCFAMREPLTLSINRQRTLCLTGGYAQCPLYVRHSLLAAEEARQRQEESQNGGLKHRLLGAFRRFGRS